MSRSTVLALLVAFMALLAIVAIIVIVARAPSTADQVTLIGVIIAFLSPLITAIIALYRAESANGTATRAKQIVSDHIDKVGPGV